MMKIDELTIKRNDYEAMSKKLVDGNKQEELPSKEQSQMAENCSLIVITP